MTIRRTAASFWAFSKPVLSGVLVLLLLVSALVSASHVSHHWLHEDDQAPSHHCLATVFEKGTTEVANTVAMIAPSLGVCSFVSFPCKIFFAPSDVVLFPERGPPSLS